MRERNHGNTDILYNTSAYLGERRRLAVYTNSWCVYHLLTLKFCEEEIYGGKKEIKTE
jgi:hypothetical protein